MVGKAAKTTGTGMVPPSMHSLPLSVASLVMEFAVYHYTPDLIPHARSLPADGLQNFSLVSKDWYHFVVQLKEQYKRGTMDIKLKNGSEIELLGVLDAAYCRGRDVKDLRIDVQGRGSYDELPHETETAPIEWGDVFAAFKTLKRLDLSLVPLHSRHLPEIIDAAATHCVALEALILREKDDEDDVVAGPNIERVMQSLFAAMETWYTKGGRTGLRQLTVPTRDESDRYRTSMEFLEKVTNFCPNVEYLDGYSTSYRFEELVKCEEKWVVSIEMWEKFAATCTKLRDFSWLVAPFADPYFRAFGEHPKLQLTHLDLSPNHAWNWKEYFLACDDMSSLTGGKHGYGRRAQDIGAVFSGCPALTRVKATIDLTEYRENDSEHFDLDIFGDACWTSAATHCPLLESIQVANSSPYTIEAVDTIETFTDATLVRLAKLEHFRSLDIDAAVLCSGDGISEYLRRILQTNRGDCFLSLCIEGQEFGPMLFYGAVITVLKRLAENSAGLSSRRKCYVKLSNPYRSTVSREWSSAYMRNQLRPALDGLKSVQPGIAVKLEMHGLTGDTFYRIDNISLSWQPGGTPQPTFVNRQDNHDLFRDPSIAMARQIADIFGEYAPPGFVRDAIRQIFIDGMANTSLLGDE